MKAWFERWVWNLSVALGLVEPPRPIEVRQEAQPRQRH
ncbi:PA1414 family protein [Pseudomonas sp. PIC25]|nr:PA1414 family protein [Pseudomonas sp. PIC25]